MLLSPRPPAFVLRDAMAISAVRALSFRAVAFFATLTCIGAVNEFVDVPAQYIIGKQLTLHWGNLTGYIQHLQLATSDYHDFVPDIIGRLS